MKANNQLNFVNSNKQTGATLVIGLLMLLLLTIIGISGMSNIILQEKMVSNYSNFQAVKANTASVARYCESLIWHYDSVADKEGETPIASDSGGDEGYLYYPHHHSANNSDELYNFKHNLDLPWDDTAGGIEYNLNNPLFNNDGYGDGKFDHPGGEGEDAGDISMAPEDEMPRCLVEDLGTSHGQAGAEFNAVSYGVGATLFYYRATGRGPDRIASASGVGPVSMKTTTLVRQF